MAQPRVESYRFGRMVVDGEAHGKDLILLPGGVVPDWWRESGHRLRPQDLEAVFEAGPEVLVVGQGAYGRMSVPEETRRAIEERGIELVAAKTAEAVDRYNELRGQRPVAGAFHLTC